MSLQSKIVCLQLQAYRHIAKFTLRHPRVQISVSQQGSPTLRVLADRIINLNMVFVGDDDTDAS